MTALHRDWIVYLQYTNPAGYPPLEHSSRILADRGWHVLFLGTEAQGTDALRFPPHPNIEVKQLPFAPPGWRQKANFTRYMLWVFFWVIRLRPRWLYASDPLATPAALLCSLVPRVRLLYHEHDSPSQAGEATAFMRAILWARRRVARRAALTVLPNVERARLFKAQTGAEPLVVWNCPRRDEVNEAQVRSEDKSLHLLYHGSIVPERLPTTVLQAMALLPHASCRLTAIGYETIGHRGYGRAFMEHAAVLGIEHQVVLQPAMSRYQLLQETSYHDVGLALMPSMTRDVNLEQMVGASNKPFDYMAGGLALLVTALPDWCRTFVDPGYGLSCNPDDPDSIAAALRWFIENRDARRAMGEVGRDRILTEWHYEKQFEPVFSELNRNTSQSVGKL